MCALVKKLLTRWIASPILSKCGVAGISQSWCTLCKKRFCCPHSEILLEVSHQQSQFNIWNCELLLCFLSALNCGTTLSVALRNLVCMTTSLQGSHWKSDTQKKACLELICSMEVGQSIWWGVFAPDKLGLYFFPCVYVYAVNCDFHVLKGAAKRKWAFVSQHRLVKSRAVHSWKMQCVSVNPATQTEWRDTWFCHCSLM